MAVDTHDNTLAQVGDAIRNQRDPRRALQHVVGILKREVQHYTWVGIYLLEGEELVLGPFLGKPSPHTRIPIACSLETKSEIVVPIMSGERVLGEIDIDSDQPAAFGAEDRRLLESVASLLAPVIGSSA